jgi:hypothetical protein
MFLFLRRRHPSMSPLGWGPPSEALGGYLNGTYSGSPRFSRRELFLGFRSVTRVFPDGTTCLLIPEHGMDDVYL